MSLGFRLNLLIVSTFILILLPSAGLIIVNTREAVSQELESSAELALQLLTAATVSGAAENSYQWRLALKDNLNRLSKIRHLNISILSASDKPVMPVVGAGVTTHAIVPRWFSGLVEPFPREYRRRISSPGLPYAEIIIRPDPTDEIAEAWRETGLLLLLLVLLVLLVNGLVFLVINRALRPVKQILAALSTIEQGNYGVRLPRIKQPELNQISLGFNRMAMKLERERREKLELTKRSLVIQEEERRRLASELHDELGQSINAIKAVAVSISQRGEIIGTQLREGGRTIVSISDHIHNVIRKMISRLRPIVLDELGLKTALERMVDDWNTHYSEAFCRLMIDDNLDHLGEEREIGVYRIIQECLTNIAKHAQASDVSIHLQISPTADCHSRGQLMIEVADNGKGFDPREKGPGLGLVGIRERTESLNGSLGVVTQLGAGVRIRISIPCAAEQNNG